MADTVDGRSKADKSKLQLAHADRVQIRNAEFDAINRFDDIGIRMAGQNCGSGDRNATSGDGITCNCSPITGQCHRPFSNSIRVGL